MTAKAAFPPAVSLRALVSKLPFWAWQIGIAFAIYLVVSYFILAAFPEADPKLRFSLEPILTASAAIQIHEHQVLLPPRAVG